MTRQEVLETLIARRDQILKRMQTRKDFWKDRYMWAFREDHQLDTHELDFLNSAIRLILR